MDLSMIQVLKHECISIKLGNLIVECAKCYGLHVLLTKSKEKTWSDLIPNNSLDLKLG
jgi:hypothetical protein